MTPTWTEQELRILKENYSMNTRNEFINLLPNKTYGAIKSKAFDLGLRRAFERKCATCGGIFVAREVKQKYCSRKCYLKYYEKCPIRYKFKREWLKRHPEKTRYYRKTYYDKFYAQWGHRQYYNHTDPLVIQSELFIATQVLPKYNFTDIVWAREFSAFFPCDILCRKDGQICLIEVTLEASRKVNPRIIPLVKFLNAKVFVCHVKHDFSFFLLKEVDVDKNLYSSCLHEFRRVVCH